MRNYAPQLIKSFALASGVFYPEVVSRERALAKDYDESKRNQVIILYNEESKEILKLPYFYRLKPEYARTVRRKIWKEAYPQIKDCHDFVFGTFDASTMKYYSQKDAHEKVQRFWNILLTRIRKRYPHVKIIKSVEWQENGIGYHVHVLFCGIRFIPIDWVRETWAKFEKSGWAVQLERSFNDPKHALAYLTKYITKNLRKTDEIPISLVVNWALGLRTIAFSRSFSFHKSNSNGKWILIGFMPWETALIMSDNEILEYFSGEKPVLRGVELPESWFIRVPFRVAGFDVDWGIWIPI